MSSKSRDLKLNALGEIATVDSNELRQSIRARLSMLPNSSDLVIGDGRHVDHGFTIFGSSETTAMVERFFLSTLSKLPNVVRAMIRLGHAPNLAIVLHTERQWETHTHVWIAELYKETCQPAVGGACTFTERVWRPQWKIAKNSYSQNTQAWTEIAHARGMTFITSSATGYQDRIDWSASP